MPNPMYVYIQTTERDWKPGSVMIPKDYPSLLGYMDDFAGYIAEEMKNMLVEAIDTQRYKRNWPSLSIPYYEYKQRNNLSLNIWEATGLLKNSIDYFKVQNKWVVGINPFMNYPDTPVRVFRVARYMEYGTENMPARPLFRPIQGYISRHIRRFWESFLDERGVTV